ncbi:BnaCnng20010D, partial [Brassica napus]
LRFDPPPFQSYVPPQNVKHRKWRRKEVLRRGVLQRQQPHLFLQLGKVSMHGLNQYLLSQS